MDIYPVEGNLSGGAVVAYKLIMHLCFDGILEGETM